MTFGLNESRRLRTSRCRSARVTCILALVWTGATEASDSPFAVSVIEFAPAPGQYVNVEGYNDPSRALGPPSGGGTYESDNSSLVSLGGFGGSIMLRFDHVVEDDPRNPFGLDAIVYGNAFWANVEGDLHWAECGTIEIALDANGNGIPDDPWYVIPGTHITDPAAQYVTQTWDDDTWDSTHPPDDASWIPPGCSGQWDSAGYLLPELFAELVVENPLAGQGVEGIYGYADYTPTLVLGDMNADNEVDDPFITPEEFYTVPDDPFTVGITPGSGGGDAFDIAWAIDPSTGLPAALPGFDFIRITTGVNAVIPFFNEKSPEIDAVADVTPVPAIPTVSAWGLIAMTLMLLAMGTIVIRNRRPDVMGYNVVLARASSKARE